MMTTRWHVCATSGRMCVLSTIVWLPASSLMSWRVSIICFGSRPAVGSSSTSTSGLCRIAWASPTRWRYPFDSLPQWRSAMSATHVRFMTASTRALRSPEARPLMRATKVRYSRTVMSG